MVVSVLGLTASFVADLPTGPAVIGCYAVVLLLVSGVLYNLRAPDRLRAIRDTAITIGLFASAIGLLMLAGRLIQSCVAK